MTTASHPTEHHHAMGLTLHNTAMGVGIVFLLVGVLGFIPGITTNYGAMTFAGHESGAMLLGVFQVSILHNIVHLLFGVAGLAMARTARMARLFLIGGGAVYIVLWIYGLIINQETGANFVPFNTADNWLHLILGVAMIGLGAWLGRDAMDETTAARRRM
ncbi:DUF4383 domain-containing protein [Arthrobacter sp. StoSoilB5]|jgi:hypothetical protein|uniref:DUF4383 domain-containing protein n=1 Tax=Arthrobacter sp. StoSoilB5 TaxID=2830992 RepID=UPI001CC5E9E8|nr:DUF4383 domain-containing protein [Arthrobacter sp. StoSoilB5]BCW47284.1 hypothetical protein StoSoilB5_44680 [Arthrobacter sp. StoSoilB5]